MSFLKEFKEFAIKGNVFDLAVAVIIGGAFGKIVSSLVDDIITPAILTPALKAAHLTNLSQLVVPGTAIKYGNFLSQVFYFLIVAFALFVVIQGINRLKKKDAAEVAAASPEPAPAPLSREEELLTEIRDLLSNRA